MKSRSLQWSLIVLGAAMSACGPEPVAAFALKFAAVVDGNEVRCANQLSGFGPGGSNTIGIKDLRFYVSNVRFTDKDGKAVELELESDEFQLNDATGSVALIDLTGEADAMCADGSDAAAEGTARMNTSLRGKTQLGTVARIAFDIGVPQPLMKSMIATNTAEAAPSPMNEMYWSWASGYRHFVFNFSVQSGSNSRGGGNVHIGSRDCGPDDGKALEDRATCTYVNTPAVAMTGFDLKTNTIGIDLKRLLTDVDFVAPIYDPQTFQVIGQGPGVACHSAPTQPHCANVFAELGLDSATGLATAASNEVFVKR